MACSWTLPDYVRTIYYVRLHKLMCRGQPHNTRWLSKAERRLAQVRLAEDAGEADEDSVHDTYVVDTLGYVARLTLFHKRIHGLDASSERPESRHLCSHDVLTAAWTELRQLLPHVSRAPCALHGTLIQLVPVSLHLWGSRRP